VQRHEVSGVEPRQTVKKGKNEMTRGTALLSGVGVLGVAVVVFLGRTAPSPNTGAGPVNDPRSDCIAYANAVVEKNPQAAWLSVYDNCASNHPAAGGERLDIGPKAVRTESIPAPIGTRSSPAGR
jgi:hypothetical protein